MTTFIKGATILAMGRRHGAEPFTGDVLIEGDRITAISTVVQAPAHATIIDGAGKLVMPGLMNAHLHSNEALFKGRYDNMPLEVWMLYSYPILAAKRLPERLVYLRSMLVAIESLKTGVTCLTDDLYESPKAEMELLDAAFQAYDDIGIRATVSAHGRYHGRSGRLRFMLAPSAPQRCTPELMLAANDLAKEWGVPFHTHIVETKVQGVTGPALYGKSLMRYMNELGLLNPWTTIAHSIWVSEDDIALMGAAGVSVVHNTISNQKLGAGIAPVRRLLEAGVNVALGSDGICSNDTPRMFDVMKAAGLAHKINNPDWSRWLTAPEVLHACTLGGARSALIEKEIGSLEVGKKADLLILNMHTVNFAPLNDIRNHLVYCENGSSIETVMVNGEVVVQDGRLTKVNEKALLAELRDLMPEFQAYTRGVEVANRRFEPAFADIIRRCYATDLGFTRWASDAG
jgi:5-methylthioadenosine/S-adenosylhomocysteine deaminase